MRIILVCVFVMSLSCTASAQTPESTPVPKCTLSIAQAPALRGFKLGMTIEQIKARFPTVDVKKPNEFGYTPGVTLAASSAPDAEKANFDNVEYVNLAFLDGRLVSIHINYMRSAKWDNVGQFIPLVTAKYNLDGEWKGDDYNRRLTCEGFTVNVYANRDSASLSVSDSSSGKTVELRRKEKEEAARRAFKP